MKKTLLLTLALSIATPATVMAAQPGFDTEVVYGVNYRSAPSTDSHVYRMLPRGEDVRVIRQVNNYWLEVQTQDGQTGYISANSKYTNYNGQVSAPSGSSGTITWGVNFRSSPKVDNNKIGYINKGSVVEVLEETNAYWVKVRHNGKVGYVSAKYISISGGASAPSSGVEQGSKADQIINFAKSLRGKVTYEFGVRNTSRLIFDCSSFTQYVFEKYGVDMKWGTRYQKDMGRAVSKSNLQKGDLVFFGTSSRSTINHVGIYIGGGEFIHNSPSANGITINSLNSGYWKDKYISARRVL